jgi:putative SOS response-associated peptidase YedK
MCYDIKASTEAQLKRARRRGDSEAERQIRSKLLPLTDLPLFHASGFSHPSLLIYTNRSGDFPEVATWGLVPFWVKDEMDRNKLWNKTLNARGETIFEKPAFRDSARNRRCLIYLDGFYEHHHFKGKTYPYFISSKNGEPLIMAGLWSEWWSENSQSWLTSFTIVTTKGNMLLSEIHNNPDLEGPRMPALLTAEEADQWLVREPDPLDKQLHTQLIRPFPNDQLQAHTVRRLRGKEYPGNIPEISIPFHYPELEEESLF